MSTTPNAPTAGDTALSAGERYRMHDAFLATAMKWHQRGNTTWYLEPEYVNVMFDAVFTAALLAARREGDTAREALNGIADHQLRWHGGREASRSATLRRPRAAMTLTLVLWLPKPPDNANGRQHWAVANKAKRAYWDELHRRFQTGYHFAKAPTTAIERATLSVEWFAERKQWMPDKDNITRRLKPAVDWLVTNQWLAGDTAEHVSWTDHVVHPKRGVAPPLCTVRLSISVANLLNLR